MLFLKRPFCAEKILPTRPSLFPPIVITNNVKIATINVFKIFSKSTSLAETTNSIADKKIKPYEFPIIFSVTSKKRTITATLKKE